MNQRSIEKEELLKSMKESTLKSDPDENKKALYQYVKDVENILTSCKDDEEIPLMDEAYNKLTSSDNFDRFVRDSKPQELRDWFVNLIVQCQIYVAPLKKTKGLVECLDNTKKIHKKDRVFRCIMIPIVLALMLASILLTFLGKSGVFDGNLAGTISELIGLADFLLAGVFFICEQISDAKKEKSYIKAETHKESTIPDIKPIKIINIDNSIHMGDNIGNGVQVGKNSGTGTINNTNITIG